MSKLKERLMEAFLHLIEKEELDKISVTALVSACGVSRQTFYYHFSDIKSMLRESFEAETKRICAAQTLHHRKDSAQLFIDFFNRYDTFFRKCLLSQHFLFVYNLIYDSLYIYIHDFLCKRQDGKPLNAENEFMITYITGAYCHLILQTLQKSQSDYAGIFESITAGCKLQELH